MSIFPVITKEKQRMYEKMYLDNEKLENNVPCICGYYGRACRQMNNKADRMLCNGCELSIFVSTLEAILEVSNDKEKIGIKSLYDSDIYDVQSKLKEKCINVKYSYIENVLDELVKTN